MVLRGKNYTVQVTPDGVLLKSTRRYMRFSSLERLYTYSVLVKAREDWMRDYMPDLLQEQIQDGIHGAFNDFRVWYESRKSRAKKSRSDGWQTPAVAQTLGRKAVGPEPPRKLRPHHGGLHQLKMKGDMYACTYCLRRVYAWHLVTCHSL